MKKTVLLSLSAATVLLFTQCSKENCDKNFNANFYTTNTTGKLSLYIDDAYKGELPVMQAVPQCGANYGDGTKPLSFNLKSGKYKVTGKNAQGQVVSQSTMTINGTKIGTSVTSGSGAVGGISIHNTEDCLAVGIFY